MDFLDIFNDNNDTDENNEIVRTKINIVVDRKRKLDQFLSTCIDNTDDFIEKKPKLNNDLFSNPFDNICHKVVTGKNCKHEVFYSKSVVYKQLKPREKVPAKEFPFILDAFQSQAVKCIENNQNTLVSAHTSAGKTVCASYAIALCIKEKRRIIYTTPIKALSNQKYREFKEEFEDVGLLTGDVTIDANATVLIMTTEILLLMIYKSSSVLKEVGWVVYDEVHYMRDKFRGVVWEQSIILMPADIRMMFLSATIPNSQQFGQWIAHIRSQPCNVIYTNNRPTPLIHYIYPNGADTMYQVVNEKGEFLEEKFNEAMSVLRKAGDNAKSDMAKLGRKGGSTSLGTHCEKLIKKVFQLKNDPAIVFSFSKQSCETYARLFGKLNYSNKQVKDNIELVFENARNTLPEEDRKMPQLDAMLGLMKRGISVHHSGLLPILKEVAEILFGEGLSKCLFATETFSMGLNMPAKTVIFTDILKFDGDSKRLLKSGEYIQMAGRAGRRGLDTNGNVIIMIDRTINSDDAKKVIMGDAEPLNSSFHLTYPMILNLIRSGTVTPEYLMERSFLQFQVYSELPSFRQKLKDKEEELSKIVMSPEEMKHIRSYVRLERNISAVNEEIWSLLRNEDRYRTFVIPGRLVHVKRDEHDYGWCIVMSRMQSVNSVEQFAECLVPVNRESIYAKDLSEARPPLKYDQKPDALLLIVTIEQMFELSSVVIQKAEDIVGALRTNDLARREYLNKRNSVLGQFHSMPLLDKKADIQWRPKMATEYEKKLAGLEQERLQHNLHSNLGSKARISLYHRKIALESDIGDLITEINKKTAVLNMDELKARKRLLRRLQYLSDSDVLTTKGRVACEITSANSLMVTESMLAGKWSGLTGEQLVGVLSCFVCDEDVRGGSASTEDPGEDLTAVIDELHELSRTLGRASGECRLPLDEQAYMAGGVVKVGLVTVVRRWAAGASFGSLCGASSGVHDGNVIRCVRRVDELLGQLTEAARVIGNMDLEGQFSRASAAIRRGIVFAASLYLTSEL